VASRSGGVTLTDASALVALLDPDEKHHARCVEIVGRLQGLLLTTWPAFTEAMYLLGRNKGWPAQNGLWRLVLDGVLAVAQQAPSAHMASLMEKYRDLPMALADASLIELAEQRDVRQVFSLDSDFRVYRTAAGNALELVPE
jgi:predicted nucleic acid-binding protein